MLVYLHTARIPMPAVLGVGQLLQMWACAWGVMFRRPSIVVDACADTHAPAACEGGAVVGKCGSSVLCCRHTVWLLGRGATRAGADNAATPRPSHTAHAAVHSLHAGAPSHRRSINRFSHMHRSFGNNDCYALVCARRSWGCRRTCAPGGGRASRRRSSKASARPFSFST